MHVDDDGFEVEFSVLGPMSGLRYTGKAGPPANCLGMIIIAPSDDVDGREVRASAPSSSGQVTSLSGEAPDEGGLLQLHAENAGPGRGLPLPSWVLRRLVLLLLLSPLG